MSDRAPTGPPGRICVLVADDSAVARRFLRSVVAADPGLYLAGEVSAAEDLAAEVRRLSPDVVVMDLLGRRGALDVIRRVMAEHPTAVLVYSAHVSGADQANAGAARSAGALDVLAKPGPRDGGRLEEYADELRRRIRMAARAAASLPAGPVWADAVAANPRPVGGGPRPLAPGPRPLAPARPATGAPLPPRPPAPPVPRSSEQPWAPVPALHGPVSSGTLGAPVSDRRVRPVRVVVVGASTGGPPALARVLGELPADLPAAVVVVQHMAEGFIDSLVGWLDGVSGLPVSVATDGAPLRSGTVVVAPNGANLVVDASLRVRLTAPPERQRHVPGVDAAFISVAHRFGSAAVGVLLTGMGDDGALGMKALRDRGAHTIAQDAATCAVYGMPAAAVALGGASEQLPLDRVAATLCRLVRSSHHPSGALAAPGGVVAAAPEGEHR